MKIKIAWDVNEAWGFKTFDIRDLNVDSEEEWDALSELEQQQKLEDTLDECPEQPYMCVDNWNKV